MKADDRTTANVAILTDPTPEGEGDVERSFLVVSSGGGQRSRTRVVPLPEGQDVTLGRLDSCTVPIDFEAVSRTHVRIVKRGRSVIVEDLGSRNGTWINGARIKGKVRVSPGDEIAVGPVTAVVAITTSMRRQRLVGSVSDLEERLAAEVDRAGRYHRTLGLVMLRLEGTPDGVGAAVDHVAQSLRGMDSLAEYGPDEFAVVLPEADRLATQAVARRMAIEARAVAVAHGELTAHVGLALYPEDGSQPGALMSRARAALRAARGGAGQNGVASAAPEELPAEGDQVIVDPVMKRVFALANKIADAAITVLIVGETGVGKEVVAEALHAGSTRKARPFVRLNCASLPETILESELFGHERGAFTGADRQKIGYFEAARGGTILLDEIGELPLGAQAKLLRVLEQRSITRLGGTAEVPVDVRVVCATNRDLESEVRRGRFREDLYFRISAFLLPVPPVRDRRTEIRPLAMYFARHFARELGQPTPSISPHAVALLEQYDWPGNVRELRNAIERAVVLASGQLGVEHLPDRIRDLATRERGTAPPRPADAPEDVRGRVAGVERDAVVAALEAAGGNQSRAAKQLGVSRFALIRLMEKYGLKAGRRR